MFSAPLDSSEKPGEEQGGYFRMVFFLKSLGKIGRGFKDNVGLPDLLNSAQ